MVSITNSDGTFTFQEGDIDTVTGRITASPDADPMPGTPPMGVVIIDFNGSKKTITIGGIITDASTDRFSGTATIKTITEQKQWLEKLVDGAQSAITFSSTYEDKSYNGSSMTNTTAVVTSITFTEHAGIPGKLDFNMELVVGS